MPPVIEAVLWDFGGVFTPSPFAAIEAAGEDLGLSPERVTDYVFGPYDRDTDHAWHRLERGELSLEDARDEIMAAAAKEGILLDPWDVLLRIGEREDPLVSPAVLAAARRVRNRELRTALVTNNIAEARDGWRSLVPVDELFEIVIDSSEVGVRKPDSRIFALALHRLGDIDPSRAVFLDDYEGNVTAARDYGLNAIKVATDPTAALAALDSLLER